MIVRVLVVDDSRFFRRRVTEMLESDARIRVIGEAENGSEAIQKAGRLKPDIITMDVEMPVMDGITATKRILANQRVPILMFSSLTTEGAQATFDALDAGAVDYLPKRFEDISTDKDEAKRLLCERILNIVKTGAGLSGTGTRPAALAKRPAASPVKTTVSDASRPRLATTANAISDRATKSAPAIKRGQFKLLAIGTSTGGPVALQKILSVLPKNFPMPIVLVQHMPGSFTTAFAARLNQTCQITVAEAQDGDVLEPGKALLAPGGKQMTIEKSGARRIVRIRESDAGQNYQPCVDITFDSLVRIDPAHTLAIILTGMGADGCKGSEHLKRNGSSIWAQDEASCVVFGMPGAVVEAGIADQVMPLDAIGTTLAQGA